jgi:error-prone DNA polymerase
MARRREEMNALGIRRAIELKNLADGRDVRVAGCVIVRQRPGTAKGFVFLSLEDETGIANVILKPDVFERLRVPVLSNSYLIVDGILQNQRGVASIKATDVRPCVMPTTAVASSHDFH